MRDVDVGFPVDLHRVARGAWSEIALDVEEKISSGQILRGLEMAGVVFAHDAKGGRSGGARGWGAGREGARGHVSEGSYLLRWQRGQIPAPWIIRFFAPCSDMTESARNEGPVGWRQSLLAWVDSNELPWMPPRWWRGEASEREVWELRREARKVMRRKLARRIGWPKIFVQALVWPAWAALKAAQNVRWSARTRYAGKSKGAIWWDGYWLQLAYNIRISDQLDVCLNLPEQRGRVRGFMVCREQQILLGRAHQRTQGVQGLDGKVGFARFCEANGLPAPRPLSEGVGEKVTRAEAWPARDLIFKPADLAKGVGIVRLAWDAEAGAWRTKAGGRVDASTVAEWAREQVGDAAWLVQVFLRNHGSWARFTTGGLATCRVVTGRLTPGGEPFLMGAFARFPLDHEAVDNLSAGGIGMGVDMADGRLTAGTIWVGDVGHHDRHPRTGAKITGEYLPGWAEMAELALRAHRAAGDWSSIGWDVAFTEDGPVLIEANLHWAVFFHQPTSATRLAEVLRAAEG